MSTSLRIAGLSRVVLFVAANAVSLLMAWYSLPPWQHDNVWPPLSPSHTLYWGMWRAPLYGLMFVVWARTLRSRKHTVDPRLKHMGLFGFGCIALVELSRI